MKWHNFIREYFTHSRRERRGILVLTIVVVVLFILMQLTELLQPKTKIDFADLNRKIDAYNSAKEADQKSLADKNKHHYIQEEIEDQKISRLFEFNPNNLPIEKWMQLGLSRKQAEVIKKYEAKGGKFFSKKDVEKMYTISSGMYKKLEPYIVIPNEEREKEQIAETPKPDEHKPESIINLNTADTSQLQSLRGIGSVFSRRIVKYRDLLGGYYAKEQLLEVYGMKKETYEQIKDKVQTTPSTVKTININTCTADELRKHPYINWNIANSIVAIREKHGPYKSVDEIQKSDLVDEQLSSKIAPYLAVQ